MIRYIAKLQRKFKYTQTYFNFYLPLDLTLEICRNAELPVPLWL